jgi:endonuclease YncB( thermonuclease family)
MHEQEIRESESRKASGVDQTIPNEYYYRINTYGNGNLLTKQFYYNYKTNPAIIGDKTANDNIYAFPFQMGNYIAVISKRKGLKFVDVRQSIDLGGNGVVSGGNAVGGAPGGTLASGGGMGGSTNTSSQLSNSLSYSNTISDSSSNWNGLRSFKKDFDYTHGGQFVYRKMMYESQPDVSIAQAGAVSPNSIGMQMSQQYHNTARYFGIYGFLGGSALESLGGQPYTGSKKPTIASAENITSPSRWLYEDINPGGVSPLGFEFSEIFRRFLTHNPNTHMELNPIPNMVSSWMPGASYMQNFHEGDPYVKGPNFERRIEGKLYEQLHNIDINSMWIGPSTLSKSSEDIYRHFTNQQAVIDEQSSYKMEAGNKLHKEIEAELVQNGMASKSEVAFQNKDMRVNGFIDVVNQNNEPIEIKTLSENRWRQLLENGSPFEEHEEQVMFYMNELKAKQGQLLYVRQSDPKERISYAIQYNQDTVNKMKQKLDDVRSRIQYEVKNHMIPRGELYPDIQKLSILGDVAPWSTEYWMMLRKLKNKETTTSDDMDKIQRIEHNANEVRRRNEFTNYAYNSNNVKKKVKIDSKTGILDFTAEGENHPFRIVGMDIRDAKHDEAIAYLQEKLAPGNEVGVEYSSDEYSRYSQDIGNPVRAVVKVGGKDIAEDMINKGLAIRNQEFQLSKSSKSIVDRGIWGGIEQIGHMPIPFLHTKLMNWETALESYKRHKVYAPGWQKWTNPIGDFIIPTIQSYGQENPIVGVTMGAGLGAILAKNGYRNKGALIGGGIVAAASTLMSLGSFGADKWVPGRTAEERDMKEYFDKLQYMKYSGLYERTREKIKKEGHYDIGARLDEIEAAGRKRNDLDALIRTKSIKDAGIFASLTNQLKQMDAEDAERKLKRLPPLYGLTHLNPTEALAAFYRKKMKQTMYGADPRGSLADVMAALPKDERPYFSEFLKAPGNERKEIWRVAPQYMKKFLAPYYGIEQPGEVPLEQYFKNHYLPKEDWIGWSDQSDMEGYKMQTFVDKGFSPEEAGFFPEEQVRYSQYPHLKYNGGNNVGIESQVHTILQGMGLQNITLNAIKVPADSPSNSININIQSNRKDEINSAVDNM